MSVIVRKPGVTTVQDAGRKGLMSMGFAPCGAMDADARVVGNLLAGNAPDAPLLEFALMGPTLEFDEPLRIALTGACFAPLLNGAPVCMYAALDVAPGDVLSFGPCVAGTYGYVAVSGGIAVPQVLGSASTYVRAAVGGVQGRTLAAGDVLPVGPQPEGAAAPTCVPFELAPTWRTGELRVRAIPGPQEDLFVGQGVDAFYGESYQVTAASDRMGMRLEGAAIQSVTGSDIISDGIPLGAVQVPASGQPLVMLADRQTVGGYGKIAVVATVDVPTIAQARPGQRIRFVRVSVEQAQEALREKTAVLEQWQAEARAVAADPESEEACQVHGRWAVGLTRTMAKQLALCGWDRLEYADGGVSVAVGVRVREDEDRDDAFDRGRDWDSDWDRGRERDRELLESGRRDVRRL